jgi:hypothetical protein
MIIDLVDHGERDNRDRLRGMGGQRDRAAGVL